MSRDRVTFTVLLPFFNADATLDEAIESILVQTESDWELLLVDDHSTDHSRDIADSWRTRDSRVQVHTNKGKGIVDALNTGIERSKGEWVARMDSDDISSK